MEALEWGKYTHYWSDNKPILFIQKLLDIGLDEDQIKGILDAMNTTCEHCWDSEKRCQCSNDE